MSQEGTQKGVTMEGEEEMSEETFLKELYAFMKNRDTPIERIPHLGFKQIDLFVMFKTVQSMGGYNQVSAHQLWKQVYNKLGGNPRSTSAATCTRRHYEKLILPYECYLRGEDDKTLTPPRQQKRLRYPHDDEVLRGGKRSAAYGQMHSIRQSPHDFFADRIRIIPMPMNLRQCFPSNTPPLPVYLPLSPTMSPHQALYLSPPPEVSEQPRQHLEHLRALAHDYMSSAGWAEPLNLSCKGQGVGTICQQPSSFTPTSNKKVPKFLNEVSPLYSASSVAKDEGPEMSDTEMASGKPGLAPQGTSPLRAQVIDLTSSTASKNMAPAIEEAAFDHIHLQKYGPTPQDAFTSKLQEKIQSKEEGKDPKPSQSPLNLSCSTMTPPKESTGRMEIQIPLALLQDWIKGNLISGFQQMANALPLQSSRAQLSGEGAGAERQVNVEAQPMRNKPPNLSFHDNPRDRWGTSEKNSKNSPEEEDKNITRPFSKESQTTNHDHYTSISYRHHPLSPGIKAKDLEPGKECRGGSAQHHAEVFPKSVMGSNPFPRVVLQNKDCVAQKFPPTGMTESQDLTLARGRSQVQTMPMQSSLGPSGQEEGSTGPLSLTYRSDTSQSSTSPTRPGPCGRPQSMNGSSTIFMVNPSSSSVLPLTHEEYMKLRRLISSSP
ncbi:hypothetical protein AGOR_G00008340 [Albula goreensis]|uniref:ARID domain-containing protein n=1 Tax=Albula goreensis TaxID=1534307 RepID=A0A8T3E929_9TELE|nr:hypothetical protein AGOR_G00008340 [Albula goreensis]